MAKAANGTRDTKKVRLLQVVFEAGDSAGDGGLNRGR